jgi:hypothetical protein
MPSVGRLKLSKNLTIHKQATRQCKRQKPSLTKWSNHASCHSDRWHPAHRCRCSLDRPRNGLLPVSGFELHDQRPHVGLRRRGGSSAWFVARRLQSPALTKRRTLVPRLRATLPMAIAGPVNLPLGTIARLRRSHMLLGVVLRCETKKTALESQKRAFLPALQPEPRFQVSLHNLGTVLDETDAERGSASASS